LLIALTVPDFVAALLKPQRVYLKGLKMALIYTNFRRMQVKREMLQYFSVYDFWLKF